MFEDWSRDSKEADPASAMDKWLASIKEELVAQGMPVPPDPELVAHVTEAVKRGMKPGGSLPILFMSEQEVMVLGNGIGKLLIASGLKNPALDETLAAMTRIALSAIDRQKGADWRRRHTQ
jgi:hypothetical protein